MARLIKSTKEKIERLNKLVESNTDFKEILKQEWQGSHKAKDKWVNKFKEYLSEKVLIVLEQRDKALSEEIQEKQKLTECNTEAVLLFLQDKDNFEALQKMIEKFKKFETIEELVVPTEYLTASTSIKSIRVNSEIYDNFTSLCKEHNLTIGSCITYALALFVEKFK